MAFSHPAPAAECSANRNRSGVFPQPVKTQPSTLLVFGNPALGTQFITANPSAGLDWPVRLLVTQDATGAVWTQYTDFHWIARRHHIRNRDAVFNTASEV